MNEEDDTKRRPTTADEWAGLARLMDAGAWLDAEECACGARAYFEPHDDWCVDQVGARGVLSYRDKVAAGLTDEARGCLQAWADSAAWDSPAYGLAELADRDLVDPTRREMVTCFGHEILRVLKMPQRFEVTEGVAGMWHYHLRRVAELRAVCGALVMGSGIPIAHWGRTSANWKIRASWCEECTKHVPSTARRAAS